MSASYNVRTLDDAFNAIQAFVDDIKTDLAANEKAVAELEAEVAMLAARKAKP